MSDIQYGNWCRVYPCSEGCGFVLPPSAFSDGRIYQPCQWCGASIGDGTARRKYGIKEVEKSYFFGLFKKKQEVKVHLGWEMRGSEANG